MRNQVHACNIHVGLFFFAVHNVNVISGFKYFLFNFSLANRGRWVGIMSFKAASLTHICGTYNHTCSTTFESNWGLDSNQDAKMLFFFNSFQSIRREWNRSIFRVFLCSYPWKLLTFYDASNVVLWYCLVWFGNSHFLTNSNFPLFSNRLKGAKRIGDLSNKCSS